MSEIKSSAVPSVPKPDFSKNSSAGSDLKTTPIGAGVASNIPFSPAKSVIESSSNLSPITAKEGVSTKP